MRQLTTTVNVIAPPPPTSEPTARAPSPAILSLDRSLAVAGTERKTDGASEALHLQVATDDSKKRLDIYSGRRVQSP